MILRELTSAEFVNTARREHTHGVVQARSCGVGNDLTGALRASWRDLLSRRD